MQFDWDTLKPGDPAPDYDAIKAVYPDFDGGRCPAVNPHPGQAPYCLRNRMHEGQHVALGFDVVLAVWSGDV